MEKKDYIIPETTLFYPETESALLQTSPDNEIGEGSGEDLEAKKLIDKLFDDEEEL